MLQLDNYALDKKTLFSKENDEYVLNRVITQGEKTERSSHTFPQDAMKGFISEGSNLLLMRLMVKKGLPAAFQAISFDSDGNLCKSPYVSLLPDFSKKLLVKAIELLYIIIKYSI